MSKNKFTPEQIKTIEQWFAKYCSDICKEVVRVCKTSFITAESVGDSWRKVIEYSFANENHIKLYTSAFLKNVSEDIPEFRDTDLLQELTKRICRFLAEYTYRPNCRLNASSEEKEKQKHEQAVCLFRTLYTDHKALQRGLKRHKREAEKFAALKEQSEKPKEKRIRMRIKSCKIIAESEVYNDERQAEIEEQKLDEKIRAKRKEIKKLVKKEAKHRKKLQQMQMAAIHIIINGR